MPYYIKPKKKKAPKEKKPRQPSTSTLVKKLDKEFSRYIRLRDAFSNGTFKCISCGRIKPIGEADCGHFWSRAKMATRFSELNCNAECRACNRFSADHLIGYRSHLIEKIGQAKYDMLQIESNSYHKWHPFELEELIRYYRLLADRLAQEKGINL